MRTLRILAAAAEEAAEAAAWYEKARSGLGVDFQNAIEAALDVLEQDIVPLTPVPRCFRCPWCKAPDPQAFPLCHHYS